jgi:endonuclease/exonuclease/phosphatase (EEP) superfamily protein YafD
MGLREASSMRKLTLSDGARTVIAWALAGPCALWALVRLLGLERGFPFVPLMAYTPYVVIASLMVAGCAVLMRRWVPAALSVVAAIALALVVLPRVVPNGDPAIRGAAELRLLTANIGRGQAAEELIDLVRREEVDLLSVQELTPEAATELRRGLERTLPFHTLAARGGVNGSGLYSRFALRNLGLVPGTFSQPRATLRLPGGRSIDVVCVHPLAPASRLAVGDWHDDLDSLPRANPEGPLQLLAGDFNATLDHDQLRDLIGSGYRDAAEVEGSGLVPTWPTDRIWPPGVTIDHILADRRIGISAYEVHDLPDTDHRSVVATLSVPTQPRR